MRRISLRRLLSRLTVLALSAAPVASNAGQVVSAHTSMDEDDGVFDTDLPIDRGHMDQQDAAALLGRHLAQALGELRPLAATHLATTWALSEDPLRRGAIASALEWVFPLLGDGVILDHLSHDPDPTIRTAVARAAWARRATGGDLGVLARLAADPDPRVSTVAQRAG